MIFVLMTSPLSFAGEDPAKFPSRSISMIITYNSGSTTDLSARKLADVASKILGRPIVPENRPGGGGVIATNDVARAEPDGYTIGALTNGMVVSAPHFMRVPYKPKEDFSWILSYCEQSIAFCVLPNARWKTLRDYIEEARKSPGKVTYASSGSKLGPNVNIEIMAAAEKVTLTHVPTSGGSEVISLLMGGHVDASASLAPCRFLPEKKVRALAVITDKRMESAPGIPTLREFGYPAEYPPMWMGIFAPKGIDPRILKKLTDAFKKAYEDPSFQQVLSNFQLTPIYSDPESTKQMVSKQYDIVEKLSKKYGLKM
jgi:tripartite-type tricarboxylate transporter receptor subunit TctC